MAWGNILLSWTRYAKSTPTRHCGRCHQDYIEAAGNCPHCSQMDENELQHFLHELEKKKKKSANLFIIFFAALLLYTIFVLFVLPVFME